MCWDLLACATLVTSPHRTVAAGSHSPFPIQTNLSSLGYPLQYLASQFMIYVGCSWEAQILCVLGKRNHVLRTGCACLLGMRVFLTKKGKSG